MFEINVDLGTERNMGGVNQSLGFGLGTVVGIEGVDGMEFNEESDSDNLDSLHSVDDSYDVSKKII